jgi:tetratricopeptide (TPR) repeat protein
MSKATSGGRPTAKVRFHRTWIISIGLFVSTLAAYWNSFGVPFVFDDLQTIQRNAFVRFGQLGLAMYPRGLLFETFKLNSILSGQEVWSYHILNFLFHVLNGFLVFMIAARILRSIGTDAARCRIFAAFSAAFFLLHPIQTESVTYISSRSELLSTFFYLLGLLVFAFWPADHIGFVCGAVVGVAYLFSLGAKETALTLPAGILLYDFLFLSRGQFRPLLSKWRFYSLYVLGASATIYYLLTVGLKGVVGSHVAGNLSSWGYFLTETRVVVRYVQLIFLPFGLNLDYNFRPSSTLFDPAVLISILVLSVLLFWAWRLRLHFPVFAFSIFWFFVTLSPTSSIMPINDVIFEHRLYLPLAGVAISLPLLVELLYTKLRRTTAEDRRLPRAVPVCSCLVLAALFIGTVARNYVWGDEVRLFTDVVSKSPLKKRPYNALAFAYYKRGDYDHAVKVLEEGMEKIPDSAADLGDTLGTMYLKQGQYDRAIQLFQKEVKAVSGEQLSVTYNNLGMAYLYVWTDLQNRQNQVPVAEFESAKQQVLIPAAEAFAKSLEISPEMTSTLDTYINRMCWLGKGAELEMPAIARLKTNQNLESALLTSAQKMAEFSDLYTIGKVAFNNGDYAGSDSYFERAEKINRDVKIVFFNHGYALTQLKQDDRAIEKYMEAIRVEPIFIEAHHNLGLIYMNRKEYAKAIESFMEVLRLEPKYVPSHLKLASIYGAQGQKDLAREHISTVLAVSPGNPDAAAIARQFGL